ncbi:MAG: ATP-binding cassette domain-containing protein [Desulfosarcinaceae bacterium]
MLRLENVGVKLGAFRLREASLHVRPGTYLVLLGPTGTGKTVLLETIAGVHRPRSGRIYIKDRDATHLAPERRHLGIVYQDHVLFPHLTVFQNIAFGLRFKGTPGPEIRKSVEEMADFLEIGHLLKRRPSRLSGGERQRVALARALVIKPYVLLLDEPLSALDRATRSRIQNELKRVHAEFGVTIIHITHDLAEAFFLADQLVVMKNGRILQEGSPEEVSRRPKTRDVAELIGIENLIEAKVEKTRVVTSLGKVDRQHLPTGRADLPERVCLTLPAWGIEIFPAGSSQDYVWRGVLEISAIHQTNGTGMMELTLAHESGETLKTCLSRRESENFSIPLKIGAPVEVGLLGKGLHWVP